MIETALCFGKDGILQGVLSEPQDVALKRDTAVLILNAGLLHHVGPFRLHVDLARQISALGYAVLRLDRSGVGDSANRKDLSSEDERVILDVREAMDFLERKKGVQRFTLIGLCAGAYHAHAVAAVDPRVAGAVFLDGYGYKTPGFYLRKGGALFETSRWTGYIKRKTAGLASKNATSPEKLTDEVQAETYVTEFPTQEQFLSDLGGFIARGMKLLYVYTGGVHSYYNYADQFGDMVSGIDLKGLVQTEYFAEADHTFPIVEDRAQLVKKVTAWFKADL